ncbi:phosphoesterase PA-phosphatase [Rathayibacter sp. AY1E9]|uniref:phosphatase PAP2 family protein n=1 Tax=unclassified Rathayibacter TaxID=2609250 RepID=UPI000CE7F1F9|nr:MULTISPECIES: phosphatase PAP2 family protein [unclassified Rathayibacter]PPF09787.1 phosphoesterase PA-phosphatase [Rathayibacter sp. AY1A5]PPF17019.1 phosphoesterase PA-phosphatase [Rathayibacter sp. AY1A7]PPF31028.1 phosphoesterase PA-phosphatase [Rathayibacter sp. AY1A3]PPF54023.1 phosphoesterase PA-phosphatase [Rathayibacter sp. AY1C2]PPF67849.1 phosphoesterase PA-phosphatase [Rathayibacter sp. AY1E6]
MAAGSAAARLATEVFSPAVLAVLVPVVVGARVADPPLLGVAWGALAALFVGVVPYLVIRLLMRTGRIHGDHHVPDRRERALPIALALVSIAAGLVLLAVLGAPAAVTTFGVVTVAVVLAVGVVNLVWKLSGHAAVVATCAVVVLIAYGPLSLLISVPIVLWVLWSRVRLGAHTPAQVLAGAAVGTVLAGTVWSLLG